MKIYFYGCINNVAILDKFDANVVSVYLQLQETCFFRLRIHFNLVYRKQSMQIQEISQMQHNLAATYSIDIIDGDFNYDILKVSENKLRYFHKSCPDYK